MRLTRAFCLLLLVVALLATGQAAILHPLKHVDAGGLVHLQLTGETDRTSGGSGSSLVCDTLAALVVFVGNAVARPPRSLARHSVPALARAQGFGALAFFPYQSQAPPPHF